MAIKYHLLYCLTLSAAKAYTAIGPIITGAMLAVAAPALSITPFAKAPVPEIINVLAADISPLEVNVSVKVSII